MKISKKSFDFIPYFMMTIIGARRSGKSTLISHLLKTDLKGRFKPENIFIICTTIDLTDDFKDLTEAQKFSDPDQGIIQDIMDEQLYNIKTYGKNRTPEVLIILDDIADTNLISFHSVIDKLATKGRHYRISTIISSQRLRAVSPAARANSEYFIIFSPYNLSEIEKFLEEYVLKKDRARVMDAMTKVFEKDHEFIFVDNTVKDQYKKLKHGFNDYLIS